MKMLFYRQQYGTVLDKSGSELQQQIDRESRAVKLFTENSLLYNKRNCGSQNKNANYTHHC